ncbi:MAG: hypothetical protein ACI4ME_10115 [Aristaeellaceae bacterium]
MGKKSYTGFMLWLIGFAAAMLCVSLIPTADWQLMMRLIILLMGWGIAMLAFIIWRTERVYWYNGVSYEEAEAAGAERRRAYAWRHLKVFGVYALGISVFVWVMQMLGASAWIDFTVGTIGLIVAGCCTMPIKL